MHQYFLKKPVKDVLLWKISSYIVLCLNILCLMKKYNVHKEELGYICFYIYTKVSWQRNNLLLDSYKTEAIHFSVEDAWYWFSPPFSRQIEATTDPIIFNHMTRLSRILARILRQGFLWSQHHTYIALLHCLYRKQLSLPARSSLSTVIQSFTQGDFSSGESE